MLQISPGKLKFVYKLISLFIRINYPLYPLPSKTEYIQCITQLKSISYALPALEFAVHVERHRVNWKKCRWEKDMLPLRYDTTVMPDFLFDSAFLRYYFPTVLSVMLRVIFQVGHLNGNVDWFIVHAIFSINKHWQRLKRREQIILNIIGFFMTHEKKHLFSDEWRESVKMRYDSNKA